MPQLQANFNKLEQITELIHKRLDGGNITDDSPWNRRQIKLEVENALNNKLRIDLFENYGVEDKEIHGQYLVTFTDVGVLYDSTRDRAYVKLPARYISLPKNRGLFSIGAQGDETNKYLPIPVGGMNFAGARDVPFLQGQTGYYAEGDEVTLSNDITTQGTLSPFVMVQLVIAAEGDKFDVFVPANIEAEVVEYVYTSMANKKPEDKVNDNNEIA